MNYKTYSLLNQIKETLPSSLTINQPALTDAQRVAALKALLPLCREIPHPASGQTLLRWQILAYVAGVDLTIAKWLESHLDALSILHELGYDDVIASTSDKIWAVWAAEGHPTPVNFMVEALAEQGHCHGVKTWCSGANIVDYGLMTYRNSDHQSQLLTVDMAQSGITIDNSQWQAVGMQSTDTATITFENVSANAVGKPDEYLKRVGFWHGAAGVAACWYGATSAIANDLLMSYQQKPHAFKAMFLGEVSSQLSVVQHYFYHVAEQMDKTPTDSHERIIRELRQQVERTARQVMDTVGQALGAAPYCQNAHFARSTADLSVFIRQTHGAFDAQAIGERLAKSSAPSDEVKPWQL